MSAQPDLNHVLAPTALSHLDRLEAESIHILREVAAEFRKPVMLYSIGKDSAAMLHVALKAFYPAPLPFPLLHVDTLWKFKAMYELRDKMTQQHGLNLIDARVTTLGARAEDVFVVNGAAVEGEAARKALADELRKLVTPA